MCELGWITWGSPWDRLPIQLEFGPDRRPHRTLTRLVKAANQTSSRAPDRGRLAEVLGDQWLSFQCDAYSC